MKGEESPAGRLKDKTETAAAAAPRAYASVVRLASTALNAPVAFAGLTTGGWTTSALGAGEIPTPDLVHLCSLLLAQGYLTVFDLTSLEDNQQDALTFEGQKLRTMMGAPIRNEEGSTVGALCVLDVEVRTFDERERAMLGEMALLAGSLTSTVLRRKDDGNDMDEGRESVIMQPSFLIKLVNQIRTPLTEIVGFSKLVSKEVVGESRRRAQVIHDQSTRVTETLRSVLDLVQVESGSMSIEPQVLELAGQVREVVEAYRPQIRERGLWLKFDSPESTVEVNVDRGMLRRVLGIILSNAVKFTEEGGISVEIRPAGSQAVVEVRDTGPGISESFRPRLFEIFSRERTAENNETGGSGLGLAIARRLVEASGGRIYADSGDGGGATFTLSFPLAVYGEDAAVETESAVVPALRQEISGKPVVLLVEDNRVTRRVMERILRDHYQVVAAADVDGAFARAREYDLDLLLLDIALNERRTGVEVLHGIRKMPRYVDIPAVVCTAYSLPGIRDRYLATGFNGYIAKPFRKDQLIDVLQNVLETGGETAKAGRIHESVSIHLPPLPDTLPRILALVHGEGEKLDVDILSEVLQHDPVVSAWVLRLVNSAFHSLRGTVTSIDRAVSLLGAEPVANLVIAGLMAQTFSAIEGDIPRRVYFHLLGNSLATAAFSLALGRRLGLPNPEIAFTAGLLHDIGRLSLLSHDAEEYGRLWTEEDELQSPTIGKELLHFGVDHVTVGIDVSKQWDLPSELRSVIEHIADPQSAEPEFRSLSLIVAASKAASVDLLDSDEATDDDRTQRAVLAPLRHLEQLHETTAAELLEFMEEESASVKSFAQTMERS